MDAIMRLSVAERVLLLMDIWDSLQPQAEHLMLTEAQRRELDRRLEEHERDPDSGVRWEKIRACFAGVARFDPDVMSGQAVFTGTRVPVRNLLDYTDAGDSVDSFLEDFPAVTRQQADMALRALGRVPDETTGNDRTVSPGETPDRETGD